MNDTPVPAHDQIVADAEAAGLELVAVEDKTVIEIREPEYKQRQMNRREKRAAGQRRSAGRGKARRNLGAVIAEGARIQRGERVLEDEAHR